METSAEFVKYFTELHINSIKIGRDLFLVSDALEDARVSISLACGDDPITFGTYLGTEKAKLFTPSLALLNMISKESSRKIYLNEKGAWLFICGRDIMQDSIVDERCTEGMVLVQNRKDENLGFGKFLSGRDKKKTKNRNIAVKNIMNIGDYLKREMSKKKK